MIDDLRPITNPHSLIPMQTTRRQFLRIMGLSAAGLAAWQVGIRPRLAGLAEVSVSRVLMGTVVNLTVVGEDEAGAQTAVSATLNHMSQLEAILSRHQSTSQLSTLNRTGKLEQPSRHLVAVLQQAQAISALSGGAFDVTVKPLVDLYQAAQARGELPSATAVTTTLPLVNYQNLNISHTKIAFSQPGMSVTVDGIGKGYIVDEGTAVLRAHGFANILVEAGGDLLAAGKKDQATNWQIGIQSPRENGKHLLAKFGVENQAVATSGDYQQAYSADYRQHHILDPRTGYSAPDLASATIVADSAMMADGLATAVMVMPSKEAIALLEQTAGCAGYLVTKDAQIMQTGGFHAEQLS
ncbi:MAG: FAD:protein FMN transferase [Chloroflexota bacterium]